MALSQGPGLTSSHSETLVTISTNLLQSGFSVSP